VLLKQATTRMRILSNKLTNQTKVQRREIAELLDKGKIESAHVKVEHIIRDDYYIEVYEILQLYIGLVLARIPLLKAPKKNLEKGQQPPPPQHEIREAICTLLYASGCLEVEELREFGKQMSACYGMDFVKECLENRSEFVSFKVVSKLTFQSPDQSIVQGYLEIIAAQYDVEYTAPPPAKVNEPLSNFCGPAIDKGSGTQVFPTFDAPGPQGPPMPPPPPGGGGMPGMPPPPGAWGAPAPGTLPEPPLRPPGGPPPPGGDYAYQDPFAGLPAVPGAPEAGTQFRRTSSAERIKAHRDSPRHTPDMPGYTPGNPDAPYGGMPSFPPPAGVPLLQPRCPPLTQPRGCSPPPRVPPPLRPQWTLMLCFHQCLGDLLPPRQGHRAGNRISLSTLPHPAIQQLLSHLQQLLSHLQQLPSHLQQLPSHLQQLPSHLQQLPSHLQQLPSHLHLQRLQQHHQATFPLTCRRFQGGLQASNHPQVVVGHQVAWVQDPMSAVVVTMLRISWHDSRLSEEGEPNYTDSDSKTEHCDRFFARSIPIGNEA